MRRSRERVNRGDSYRTGGRADAPADWQQNTEQHQNREYVQRGNAKRRRRSNGDAGAALNLAAREHRLDGLSDGLAGGGGVVGFQRADRHHVAAFGSDHAGGHVQLIGAFQQQNQPCLTATGSA